MSSLSGPIQCTFLPLREYNLSVMDRMIRPKVSIQRFHSKIVHSGLETEVVVIFGCPYKSCNCPNILRNALSLDTTTAVIARLGARVWDDAVYECGTQNASITA